MQKNNLLSRVLLPTTLFLLMACQPNDVKLATGVGANSTGGNSTSSSTGNDYNKLVAYSIDRQIEALFLLKVALNPTYAEKNQLVRFDDSEKNKISIENSPTAKTDYNINIEITKLEQDAVGTVTEIAFKNVMGAAKSSKGVMTVNQKSIDLIAKPIIEVISVKKTKNDNEYLVSVERIDEMNTITDGQSLVTLNSSFLMAWNGDVAELDNDIKVNLVSLLIDRKMSKKATMKFDNNMKSELTVKLADCVSVTGDIALKQTIKSNDKSKADKVFNTTVVATDSSLSINEGKNTFNYTAKECSGRLVLDLAKLL